MANTNVLEKVKARLTAKSEKAIVDKAIAIGSKVTLRGGSALVQNLYFSEWSGEWQMDIWFKESLIKNVSVLKAV
jgi:hypothetical protein